MKQFIKKCPICGKGYLSQGLKNHIINCAKAEIFNQFIGIMNGEGKDKSFSSYVILRNNPHFRYYLKNYKTLPNNKRTLSYTKI